MQRVVAVDADAPVQVRGGVHDALATSAAQYLATATSAAAGKPLDRREAACQAVSRMPSVST